MGIDFPRRQTARLPRPGSAARRSQPLRPGHCRPHRLTRQTKGDNAQRYAAKWRLAKLLYQRDWDKQRIIDLFSVLDWMLQVPPELQRQLWHDIDQLERNRPIPYITSVERMGIEKGLLQSRQEGRQEGEVTLLERLLSKRFGPLEEATRSRLNNATLEQIESWAERVLDAKTLEDVFGIIEMGELDLVSTENVVCPLLSAMQLTIDIPQQLPDAIQCTPAEFSRQAKMAMASKLYEMGKLSSGLAAQMVGIERVQFLIQLSQYGVAMIDLDQEELASDQTNA